MSREMAVNEAEALSIKSKSQWHCSLGALKRKEMREKNENNIQIAFIYGGLT